MIKKIFYKFNSLKFSNKKNIFLILLFFINLNKMASFIGKRAAIIGGIASGKTTILDYLSNYCKENNKPIFIIYEPIKEITESNQLKDFCRDMKLNAYPFQSFIMNELNKKLIKEQEESKYNNIIIESSVIANESFVEILNKDGYISDDQKNKLSEKRIEYLKDNPINKIINLTSRSEEQELDRIKKRGRDGEIYTIEYLKNLNNAHRKTIQKYKSFGMSVLEIKNDSDELNQKNLNEMCEEICNFLMQ